MSEVQRIEPRINEPGRLAFRRAQQPEPAAPTDPEVIKFLELHESVKSDRLVLKEQCERYVVDIEVLSHRVDYLEKELAKTRMQRDTFQAGYLSMKMQVSLVYTSASAALEESKRAMLRENLTDNNTEEVAEQVEGALHELTRKLAPVPYESDDPHDVTKA